MGAELTTTEQAQLARCETVIAAGIQTFIDVGNALCEIRDAFKHRFQTIGYANFDDYCARKWNMTRQNANDLIGTAAAAENVKCILQTPERAQVRPLTRLSTADEQKEAAQIAVEQSGGKPTAKHVEAAVEKVNYGRAITTSSGCSTSAIDTLSGFDVAISTFRG